MVVSLLREVLFYRGFTPMDGSHFVIGDSLLLRFYSDGRGLFVMGDSSLLRLYSNVWLVFSI